MSSGRGDPQATAGDQVHLTKHPLSRQSLEDLTIRSRRALGKPISRTSVWRILDEAAIKPWQYEYWLFPRDARFAAKAGRVLDLDSGVGEGQPLGPKEHILGADEKTSTQARIRRHPALAPGLGRPKRILHEYERGGALQYLAVWDVRQGAVMGRSEPTTGIELCGRLVAQVMESRRYQAAERLFRVGDDGSSHRGEAARNRLVGAYPRLILVHTPVHAGWLNQVEIYFSIIQRKVLTPSDFTSLDQVERRLRLYEELSNEEPRPLNRKFDRPELLEFLRRLEARRAGKVGSTPP